MIEIHDDGVDSRDNSVSILKLKSHNLDDFNINLKLWESVCMLPLTSLSKDFSSHVVTWASSGSIVSAVVWAVPRLCLRRSSQSLSSVLSHVSFCMTFFYPFVISNVVSLSGIYFLDQCLQPFLGFCFHSFLKNCANAIVLGLFSYFQGVYFYILIF